MEYKMNIAGCERALPLCPINDELYIGAFVIFGDPELTTACAKELLKKFSQDFDGSLEDSDVIKLAGISKNTYYKYKREIREEIAL